MKTLVLFGADGMLGTYLNQYLSRDFEVYRVTRDMFDIAKSSYNDLFRFLRLETPPCNVIINAAGVIKQREGSTEDMIKVNSLFPHLLEKYATERDIKVIHISTDCVFNGLTGGYLESDNHDAFDFYGKSKSLGENSNLTIIRTSIIGEELKNKVSLLEWVKSNKGKSVNGYDNHLWNGVTCLELAKFIHDIISRDLYWKGVRHIFSPEVVSKYELIFLISKIYNLDVTVNRNRPLEYCYRNLKSNRLPSIDKSIYEQLIELSEFKINKKI